MSDWGDHETRRQHPPSRWVLVTRSVGEPSELNDAGRNAAGYQPDPSHTSAIPPAKLVG